MLIFNEPLPSSLCEASCLNTFLPLKYLLDENELTFDVENYYLPEVLHSWLNMWVVKVQTAGILLPIKSGFFF